jgi:hypothetical protein
MEEPIAGAGKKRPQLNIPIDLLELDQRNPRILEDISQATQADLLSILYDNFDLVEVALSMVASGYFDEEPIVVVPSQMTPELLTALAERPDVEARQAYLQQLVNDPAQPLRFTVVEGNRRTATAKLLVKKELRQAISVKSSFPVPPNDEIREDLSIIPAIFYPERSEVAKYLGVRHIAGVHKWDAYPKARYIASRIEEKPELPIETRISYIQDSIGDRSASIRKQYIAYKVLNEAEDQLGFPVAEVKERFSLMVLALGNPVIRSFVGMTTPGKTNLELPIVPDEQLENLELLLRWIFGQGANKPPLFTDSREITHSLIPVLRNPESREYLIKTNNLTQAYEFSDGERDFVVKSLGSAISKLEGSLRVAFKFGGDTYVKSLADQALEAVTALQKIIQ